MEFKPCSHFPHTHSLITSCTAQVFPKQVDLFLADLLVSAPETPGPREEIWPTRQNSGNSGHFDISVGSPAKQAAPMAMEAGNRRGGAHNAFGSGAGNPSMTLRNLILSPIKRPQLSRRPQMFT